MCSTPPIYFLLAAATPDGVPWVGGVVHHLAAEVAPLGDRVSIHAHHTPFLDADDRAQFAPAIFFLLTHLIASEAGWVRVAVLAIRVCHAFVFGSRHAHL